MDRRYRGLLILLGLMISLFASPLVHAGDLPRHVDPDELEDENPSASELFLLYHQLFHLVSVEDFAGAYGVLDWAFMVYAPPQTEPVLSRFNVLLGDEIRELNLTRFHIDEALESLRWMREEEVQRALGQALLHLAEANVTVGMLEDAGIQLASTLHAMPEPLLEGIEAVRELIERYLELIRRLLAEAILIKLKRGEEVEEEEKTLLEAHPEISEEMVYQVMMQYQENPLLETQLYIEADRSEVFVGTNVSIRGRLSAENGTGLQSRMVDFILDGVWVGEAVTGFEGIFSEVVTMPYVYKDNVTILAVYWPSGDDLGVFTPSISNMLVLELLYYTPKLEVVGPGWVYPGTLASISGGLSFDGESLPDFDIRITAFSGVFNAVTRVDGGFSAGVLVPAETPSGLETMRVESHPEEIYGSAVAELGLEVVRVPAELRVRSPLWIFSGGRMRVRGVVTVVGEPLNGSRIVVRSGERVVSSTSSEDGSFEAWMGLSLTLFTASYGYRVSAYPEEAWITQCTVSRSVFVVNAFTLVGGPVFLGVAIVYAFQRIQWRPGRRKEEQVEVEAEEREPGVEPEAPVRRLVSLWDFYWGAVRLFSRVSGLFMSPSQTIREYLEAVKESLGGVGYGVFRRLSLLYERWLYGAPSRGRKRRGRVFFERLRELFKSED